MFMMATYGIALTI